MNYDLSTSLQSPFYFLNPPRLISGNMEIRGDLSMDLTGVPPKTLPDWS
jgi:hypothetical protein